MVLLGLLVAVGASGMDDSPSGGYLVGVGDVIEVTSFQHEELCGVFQVSEEGSISYPLIGTIPVSGKTVASVAAELERLLEKDYFVNVQLNVDIREFRSKPVVVLGEVRNPGTVFLSGTTVLTEIIAEAGGLQSSAGGEIELRRASDGEVQVFSTEKVMTGEEGRDVEVHVGDVISVSAKQLYFVTGEINQPGQYEISRGLTLMRAISQAGGFSKFASKEVEIHRQVAGEKKIQSFDLGDIRKGKVDDPQILPDDIIIVRRRFF